MRWMILFVCLAGCSPTTLEDLRLEGEAETKKLTKELRAIETKEQLQKAKPKVKKRFDRIADVLIQVRKLPLDETSFEPTEAGEALFVEMARLYEIPGGREILESAQNDAVRRLLSRED